MNIVHVYIFQETFIEFVKEKKIMQRVRKPGQK